MDINNEKYQIGDIVQKPTGGPEMIVREINSDGRMICDWFDENDNLCNTEVAEVELRYHPTKTFSFSVGDDVSTNLKGVLKMQVVEVNDSIVRCEWYNKKGVLQSSYFKIEELEKGRMYDGKEKFLHVNYVPYK
ncbi:MAG: DUF2158 domain-containing protein [Bacteroidales bacterium]|nr:DUF2158 domain-containing protein [Bacteroidales bacterium]